MKLEKIARYKIYSSKVQKIIAGMMLIISGLILGNEVEAMERTPEQKMDSDLLRGMSDTSFDLQLQNYYEGLTQEQQRELLNRVSNYAETMVDTVNDNELNVPPQGAQGYESVIIFVAASIFGWILFRHGDILWNFVRNIFHEVVPALPLPTPSSEQFLNIARGLIARNPTEAREFFNNIMRNTNPA